MRRAINTSVKLFCESFEPTGPIVEVGSYYMLNYQHLSDLRPYFPNQQYIGCDIREGLGVDRIEDAQALSFDDKSAGTVLLLDILEHLPQPATAIAEAKRVLRDDGLLVISVPFNYRLHGFPTDFWRFTASGIYLLLSDFPDKMIFSLGPSIKPAFIFAVATKQSSDQFTIQKTQFQSKAQIAFQKSRFRGHISVFKERARDFWGHLLGRANLSLTFFDASQAGGYTELSMERTQTAKAMTSRNH
jgi:SAM-dependent methyltransferase